MKARLSVDVEASKVADGWNYVVTVAGDHVCRGELRGELPSDPTELRQRLLECVRMDIVDLCTEGAKHPTEPTLRRLEPL